MTTDECFECIKSKMLTSCFMEQKLNMSSSPSDAPFILPLICVAEGSFTYWNVFNVSNKQAYQICFPSCIPQTNKFLIARRVTTFPLASLAETFPLFVQLNPAESSFLTMLWKPQERRRRRRLTKVSAFPRNSFISFSNSS